MDLVVQNGDGEEGTVVLVVLANVDRAEISTAVPGCHNNIITAICLFRQNRCATSSKMSDPRPVSVNSILSSNNSRARNRRWIVRIGTSQATFDGNRRCVEWRIVSITDLDVESRIGNRVVGMEMNVDWWQLERDNSRFNTLKTIKSWKYLEENIHSRFQEYRHSNRRTSRGRSTTR